MATAALAPVDSGPQLRLASLLLEALLRPHGDHGPLPVGQVPAVQVEREHVSGRALTVPLDEARARYQRAGRRGSGCGRRGSAPRAARWAAQAVLAEVVHEKAV